MKKRVKKRVARKMRRRKNHLDKFFLLNGHKSVSIVALWILSVLIHTAIFNFYLFQEPISFIFAILVIPAYFIA